MIEQWIGTIVFLALMTAVYGSRSHWFQRQCPSCGLYVKPNRPKCYHCHEWLPKGEGA